MNMPNNLKIFTQILFITFKWHQECHIVTNVSTYFSQAMHRFTVDYKYEDMDVISKLVFTPSQPLRFTFTERR